MQCRETKMFLKHGYLRHETPSKVDRTQSFPLVAVFFFCGFRTLFLVLYTCRPSWVCDSNIYVLYIWIAPICSISLFYKRRENSVNKYEPNFLFLCLLLEVQSIKVNVNKYKNTCMKNWKTEKLKKWIKNG